MTLAVDKIIKKETKKITQLEQNSRAEEMKDRN